LRLRARLLARNAVCELAMTHQIAERETIACAQPPAHHECAQLAELLREKSAFALASPIRSASCPTPW
jgi:hypothetical protein